MTRFFPLPARTRPFPARSGADAAGFVLVEALASLAISALVVAALASLIGLILRSADHAARMIDDSERIDRTFAAVSRDVDALVRGRWAGASNGFAFTGLSDRIMFVRRPYVGSIDPEVVAYQNDALGDANRLLRAEATFRPGAASLSDLRFGPTETVVQSRERWVFAYGGELSPGVETFSDSWNDANHLPSAIRLSLRDEATGRDVVSLRMPLRAEAEPACAAGAGHGYCSVRRSQSGGGGDATAGQVIPEEAR